MSIHVSFVTDVHRTVCGEFNERQWYLTRRAASTSEAMKEI
jgi:hypothetical protein